MEPIQLISNLGMALFGGALIGIGVGHFWWARVRVFIFRQRLFALRDRVWDLARETNAFKDPEYLAFRMKINGLITIADFMSVNAVLKALSNPHLAEAVKARKKIWKNLKRNKKMHKHIIAARKEMSKIVNHYLFKETLSGRLYVLKLFVMRTGDPAPKDLTQVAIKSSGAPGLTHHQV